MVEKGRLEDLDDGQRTLNHRHRSVGVHDPSFRNGLDHDLVEGTVVTQPVEEVVVEATLSRTIDLCPQHIEIPIREPNLLHPFEERVESGKHRISGLMTAVVGIATEEVVELRQPLVQAAAEVELGHRELVLVCEQNTVADPDRVVFHASPS